jgi:GDPmannose 4,6-dehydratase
LTDSSNLTRCWEGAALQEVGTIVAINSPQSYPSLSTGQIIVRIDPRYFRPAEVETLLGDPSKAKADLSWVPEITLDEMVAEMVTHDLDLVKQHALLKANGYHVDVIKE